jgi:plasmid stability protein
MCWIHNRAVLSLLSVTWSAARKTGDTVGMRQLIVRNLDDELVRALKLRAAHKHRSAEAEHREILQEALAPRSKRRKLKDLLLTMPAVGDDADFARPRDFGRKPKL